MNQLASPPMLCGRGRRRRRRSRQRGRCVIPAQAGIQVYSCASGNLDNMDFYFLDSHFRGNDLQGGKTKCLSPSIVPLTLTPSRGGERGGSCLSPGRREGGGGEVG
jgi:hypothetical protein